MLADERMHDFTGGAPPTLDQLRDRYRRLAVGRSLDGEQRWFNWNVRRHGDDQVVGAMQATVTEEGTAADVAWGVGTAWQRRGFASEAATEVVEWLVSQGVQMLSAYVHPAHAASARVAERVGLLPTGEMVDGERCWRRSVDR